MSGWVWTAILLTISNAFMTLAWYGHLKFPAKALWLVVLASWGIAFFEYWFVIPANRIGYAAGLNLAQLKIMQEVITLSVFVPFAVFYLREPFKLDYLWAALCMAGAVYFMFRSS